MSSGMLWCSRVDLTCSIDAGAAAECVGRGAADVALLCCSTASYFIELLQAMCCLNFWQLLHC
jgi:hypothetical protein